MQIQHLGYRVRGFYRLADYALKWRHMITQKAQHKARVLAFWQKYGPQAAEEAFNVRKRTLYYWKKTT